MRHRFVPRRVCECIRVDVHRLLLFSLPSIHPSTLPRQPPYSSPLPTTSTTTTSFSRFSLSLSVFSLCLSLRRLTHATPREKRREEKKKRRRRICPSAAAGGRAGGVGIFSIAGADRDPNPASSLRSSADSERSRANTQHRQHPDAVIVGGSSSNE